MAGFRNLEGLGCLVVKKEEKSLLVGIAEVAFLIEAGETTVKNYEKTGYKGFPKRVDLGSKRQWRRSEIEKWVEGLGASADNEG